VAGADLILQWSPLNPPKSGVEGDTLERLAETNEDPAGAITGRTDENGRFRSGELEAGMLSIACVADDRAVQSFLALDSKTGSVARVHLELRPAARLFVLIEGERFPLLPEAKICVLDSRGFDFGERKFKNRHDGRSSWGAGSGVRFGPLPPGNYHVIATHRDGRVAEDRVTLSGTEPVQLKLRFTGASAPGVSR
jgi:hypothetical protein